MPSESPVFGFRPGDSRRSIPKHAPRTNHRELDRCSRFRVVRTCQYSFEMYLEPGWRTSMRRVAARETVELTPFISVKGLTIASMLTATLDFETPLGNVTLLFSAI